MKTQIKIIKYLLENKERHISIRKISKKLKIDYKNTYEVVKRLAEGNTVKIEKIGKSNIISLNKKLTPLIFEAEAERRNLLLKNKNLKILCNKLSSLQFPLIALIFGSYAKRTNTKNSDIDLMIISESNREKQIEQTISVLPLDIHVSFFTPEEFTSMLKSREFTVVSEVIKNNIILIGIEDYYRLIQNA